MKRKPTPAAEVASEIVEQPSLPLEAERPKRVEKCVVCGGECAPNSTEGLCWVCRRLKISAWRDTDQQAVVQE